MMKKITLLFYAFMFSILTSAQLREGDVIFPFKVSYDNGAELTLNGTGMQEMFLVDLYAGGLYLKKRSSDAMGIASAVEDMSIKIKVISRFVTSEKMTDILYDGFEKATYGNTGPLNTRIEKFISFFNKPIQRGDVFDIVYLEGKGIKCYKNDVELGTIKGEDFKFAVFKIWLGEKPTGKKLKRGMLGM